MLTLLSLSLSAHDLYLMPKTFTPAPGSNLLLSAHTCDSFPDSEQPVDPNRLTSFPPTEWRILGKATHSTVVVKGGSHSFAVQTAPKYLEMEAAAFRDYLAAEGLTQLLSAFGQRQTRSREMYSKFAKTYVVAGSPSGNFSQSLGLKIEIIPLSEPSTAHVLPIELRFNGRPLPGAQLEIATTDGHKVAGRTNAKGRLEIPLTRSGPTRLHAVHLLAVQAPSHDWESYWASFTFFATAGQGPAQ